MVAELAAALGRDPKDLLLELIGPDRIVDPRKSPEVADYWNYGDPFETYPIDTARLRRVVELAAEQAGWGKTLPKGEGLGIAVHRSFLSYVATVVQVAVDDKGKLSIPRVDTAIDCGFHVNPERIRSQIEGAAVMGLAWPSMAQITFKDGRAEQTNFDGFVVARIDEAPLDVRMHIVPADWNVPSSGVGEPGCRRSRRRCATRSSPPPASASAACRSAISSRCSSRHGASSSWRGLAPPSTYSLTASEQCGLASHPAACPKLPRAARARCARDRSRATRHRPPRTWPAVRR